MNNSESDSGFSTDRIFDEFPPISLREWEEQIRDDLGGKDYRKHLTWEPIDEFSLSPFYRREDTDSLDHLKQEPGRYPYVRGDDTTGNNWHIRENIVARTPETANHKARQAIDSGVEGLSFTMIPHPSDGMLGGDLEGTSVQDQQDFSDLHQSIDLERITLYFNTEMATPAYLAMLSNECNRRQISPERVRAAFRYDPFTFAVAHGYWPSKPEVFCRIAGKMVRFCTSSLSRVRPLAINMHPYHIGGASNVQELGIAMAIGQEYLARLTERNCSPAEISQHLHFAVPVGTSYFLEIAKLRALRFLWSRILDAYLPADQDPGAAVIHATTGTWSHSIYDSHLNTVRNTSQAMSAVIGGCSSLSVTPHDASYRRPGTFSRRMVRNIQHIMRAEAHLDRVADPAGGSYYIEKLTDELARHAWSFFQEIEKQGGFVKTVEEGFLASAINRTRQKREQAAARGETVFVGINHYPEPDATMRDEIESRFTSSSLLQSDQSWSLNNKTPLFSLTQAFREGARLGDVMQDLIQPSRQYLQTIHPGRGPSPYENIRLQTEAHTRQTGSRPTVLFIPMGKPAIRNQRMNFAANLLGCAGYELVEPLGFESLEEIQTRIEEVKPEVAVLCAPDEHYEAMAEKIGSWLARQPASSLLALAGYPEKQVETLRNHGIQYFIHKGSNRLELLQAFQHELGIESTQATDNQYIH